MRNAVQRVLGKLLPVIEVNVAVIGKVGPSTATVKATIGSKPAYARQRNVNEISGVVAIEVRYNELPGQCRIVFALTDGPISPGFLDNADFLSVSISEPYETQKNVMIFNVQSR